MIETKEQIYGRNDMVMLDGHNKIYGSLGLAEQYVMNTVEGNPLILTDPKKSTAENVITEFSMQGWTEQDGTPTFENPVPIVSAGNWNEETQKWDYEIEVGGNDGPSQTVTLTSDRPLTKWDKLEKRNGQWGWVYGSVEVDMSSEVTWVIHPGYELETSNLFRGVVSGVDKIDSTDRVFCNILPHRQTSSLDINGIYPLSNYLFARIAGIKSLEDFQEKIQGGKVLAELSTETFILLSLEEQEQMDNLEMYTPTTVIQNNVGCYMKATYKATALSEG